MSDYEFFGREFPFARPTQPANPCGSRGSLILGEIPYGAAVVHLKNGMYCSVVTWLRDHPRAFMDCPFGGIAFRRRDTYGCYSQERDYAPDLIRGGVVEFVGWPPEPNADVWIDEFGNFTGSSDRALFSIPARWRTVTISDVSSGSVSGTGEIIL